MLLRKNDEHIIATIIIRRMDAETRQKRVVANRKFILCIFVKLIIFPSQSILSSFTTHTASMKTFSSVAVAILLMASHISAFSSSSSFSGSQISSATQNRNGLSMEYIPDGISKEQWKKMKEAERNKNKGKNLGVTGELVHCLFG
jgi:hypothetical protein